MNWKIAIGLFKAFMRILVGLLLVIFGTILIFNQEYLSGVEFCISGIYAFLYQTFKERKISRKLVAGILLVFFTLVHFMIFFRQGLLQGNNVLYGILIFVLFMYGLDLIINSEKSKKPKNQKKPHIT